MKKNVLIFGLISGAILTTVMAFSTTSCTAKGNFDGGEVIGYAAMIVAFAFIFIGIKNYRDKYNGGVITFGKAFRVGLYIALIASTIYVIGWLILYHFFVPDFMDKYSAFMISKAKASGKSAAEIAGKVSQIESLKEMYKNPVVVILLTYVEALPVALVFTVISALILKRKQARQ